MKTAIEWLIGYINHLNENGYDFRPKYDENICEQAKEMEKIEKIKAQIEILHQCTFVPRSDWNISRIGKKIIKLEQDLKELESTFKSE